LVDEVVAKEELLQAAKKVGGSRSFAEKTNYHAGSGNHSPHSLRWHMLFFVPRFE